MTTPKRILRKEEVFHDEWAAAIDVKTIDVHEAFTACTVPENRIIRKRLGNLKGKRVLELGCGAGEAAVYFATQGARVVATDISGGMLKVAQRLAKHNNVAITTRKCFSHTIPFPNNSFDVVYTANTLHHVDLEETLREIHRVLKKGGVLVSWDPLAHNPVINVYRRMAMQVRTEDEHPLRMKDLKLFRSLFSRVDYETTWFFTLWIFVKFYLSGVNPNKERYWKKIITEHKRLEPTYRRLERIDRVVLRCLPFLKRYCWNIVIVARK